MDFILAMPTSNEGYDSVMSITCKFSKRIGLIPNKSTYSAKEWAAALLAYLLLTGWGIPCSFLSDRDRKFLSELWQGLFRSLKVDLLYTTAYHPQADGQSERSNQTAEISLRFLIAKLTNPAEWPTVIPCLITNLNNSKSLTTGKSPNELIYGFRLNEGLDTITPQYGEEPAKTFQRYRNEAKEATAFAAMSAKRIYDKKHSPLHLRPGDFAYLHLHKGYKIPSAWNKKLGDQYAGPFRVIKKIGRLAYRLKLPAEWKVHPVFSVAHLEPAEDPAKDPYKRPIPDQPEAVFVEGNTPKLQLYELERLLDRRERILRGKATVEYLTRWKGYRAEYDKWLKVEKLDNAKDIVADYNKATI